VADADEATSHMSRAVLRCSVVWSGVGPVPRAPGHQLAATRDRMAICRHVPVNSTVEQTVASVAGRVGSRMIYATLQPTPSALAIGRGIVVWACAAWNLPAVVDAAQVIVTELLANAVRHAGTPLRLRVSLHRRCLRLSVHDRSFTPARVTGPDHDQDPGGRGLLVVEALATAWGSTPAVDGKVVWATLNCPSDKGTEQP
jgi:hypothetical protein